MEKKLIREKLRTGAFNPELSMLYPNEEYPENRYLSAIDAFDELFPGREQIRLFSAPGRTEIGGNHTDHQHGVVLAGSVDLDVIAVVSPNSEGICRIKSEGYPMDTVILTELEKRPEEEGKAISLIRGILYAFWQAGYEIGGFDAYTTSRVIKGSGLSSSAAFEVLVGTILNGLFNQGEIPANTIAHIGQFAEKEFFGKPCGLLDQIASASGGIIFADFQDPQKPTVEKLKYPLAEAGICLCVVNTGGNHANLTQDYADITIECRQVSRALGVDFLRDANEEDFEKNIAFLRKECGDRAILRAMHFFAEQKRVFAQKAALQQDKIDTFFMCVNESGASSYDYLQNLYSTSLVQEQGLCLAIAVTRAFLGKKGACRVHGGGFAGTIQCYLPVEDLPAYRAKMESIFGENCVFELSIRPVGGYELK